MINVILGFAPTRRNIFSAPQAITEANITRKKLNDMNVDYVDISDISEDGLLHNENDRLLIMEKFKQAKIDGLFFPHTNFGTEYEVARLAKDLNVPVLLWGPKDEGPNEKGIRLRDSQCGLFATGKVLRRFKIPFTYLTNCKPNSIEFERGITNFIAICNVVKTLKNTNILQIGPRPFDFWSTMCNEGELLEKFNIQLSPIPLSELTRSVNKILENKSNITEVLNYCKKEFHIQVNDEELKKITALKIAIRNLADKYGCNAGAIQCWNELQLELGIMPCAANSLLNEEGFPVVCETDIHGAITSLMVNAAGMGEKKSFFADWTIRHPTNDNAELLQHCGPWPISCLSGKPTIGYPLAFNYPGAIESEAKKGDITLCRFDGDNGQYSLLLGNAKGIDGPYTKGTYLWVEVKNLKRLEAKLVEGPYIHHCVGIHKNVVPILFESCKYLNIKPDLYDNNEEEILDAVHSII
jgi:L-fucose isomerase-like protein